MMGTHYITYYFTVHTNPSVAFDILSGFTSGAEGFNRANTASEPRTSHERVENAGDDGHAE